MFNQDRPSIVRLLIIVAAAVIIMAGIRAAANIVNLLLLAYIIILIAAPVYRRLIKWHVPSLAAVLLILLLMFSFFATLFLFIRVSVIQFEEKMPTYIAQFEQTLNATLLAVEGTGLDSVQLPVSDSFSFGSIVNSGLSLVKQMLSGFGFLLSNIVLIIFIVFFALFEVTTLPQRLSGHLGADHKIIAQLNAVNNGTHKYIVIKTWTGLLAAAANTLLLTAVGIDFALLWGLLSFLLNYIPNVGFLIALIPPVLMAFVQFGLAGALKAVIILVGYGVINTITDNVIAPKLMGHGLNLSPLVIFVALIFWTWALGAVGAIMAVPLMVIIKIILEGYDETSWLAKAISNN